MVNVKLIGLLLVLIADDTPVNADVVGVVDGGTRNMEGACADHFLHWRMKMIQLKALAGAVDTAMEPAALVVKLHHNRHVVAEDEDMDSEEDAEEGRSMVDVETG